MQQGLARLTQHGAKGQVDLLALIQYRVEVLFRQALKQAVLHLPWCFGWHVIVLQHGDSDESGAVRSRAESLGNVCPTVCSLQHVLVWLPEWVQLAVHRLRCLCF